MYYRRWTRMHLKPGMKYFVKYGVLNPKYDKFTYLMSEENPDALQYRPHHQKRYIDKDLDTKLIDNLFLKYPDLKYEPISQNTYPGRQLNTFSYAYAFINEQKKLLKQGYSMSKAFQITQKKYHQKMQRKLDQSLLSRGLAFSNRARSFLNVYQQQSEYESRLKTQRTQREVQKYELKLQAIREAVDSDVNGIIDDQTLEYNRIFYDIRENNRNIDHNKAVTEVGHEQIPKGDSKSRGEFVTRLQGRFKNLFNQFYEHAAAKDRLNGLTDNEIISQIQSSPSKAKKQAKQLIKYLKTKDIKVKLSNGKIVLRGLNSKMINRDIYNNKYFQIALLSERLNYEKPNFTTSAENELKNDDLAKDVIKRKISMRDVRPDSFSKEDRDTIKINKRKELELVANEQLYYSKEAYKVFETQEERLLRLQIKYYDKLVQEIDNHKKALEAGGKDVTKTEEELKQLNEKRSSTILDFRRLKYRLQRRYRNISADQLLFSEHEQLGDGLLFENEVEYEELIGYLRKKSEDRRLTSLDQSKDNKINKSIRIVSISQAAVPEGTVASHSE